MLKEYLKLYILGMMCETSVQIKISQEKAGRAFKYWNSVGIQPFQIIH